MAGPILHDLPLLKIRKLSFKHKSQRILVGVNLEVQQGEIVCLLGPSGSGKTTLLNLIAGLESPSAGTIYIGGEDQSKIPAHKRKVGFVFQDLGALFPHMSVFQNVAFSLRVNGESISKDEIRQRVNRALAGVFLKDKADRKPHELSGGEKQRVALARSLVFGPKLLLLDEPLSSLDNPKKAEFLEFIERLRADGEITAVYVTHDEREALRIADRIGILVGGRIQQCDRPEVIYNDPATVDVAKITAEWNVLEVESENEDEEVALFMRVGSEDRSSLGRWPVVDVAENEEPVFCFPISSASLSTAKPEDEKLIVLSGRIEKRFFRSGRETALVHVGENQKVRTVFGGEHLKAIDRGDQVYVAIPRESVKVLWR